MVVIGGGVMVYWAYSSISSYTAPRVDGSHPGSSSLFIGHDATINTGCAYKVISYGAGAGI